MAHLSDSGFEPDAPEPDDRALIGVGGLCLIGGAILGWIARSLGWC